MNIRRWLPRRGLLIAAMMAAAAAVVVPAAPASAAVFCTMSIGTPLLNGGVITANSFVNCSDFTPTVNLSLFLYRDGVLVDHTLTGGTGGAGAIVAETCRPGTYQATASATIWYPPGNIPGAETINRSTGAISYNCLPTVVVANPGAQTTLYPDSASLQMTASGGSGPYTWSATGLPTGLSINSSTGLISGRPTVLALYSVTVRATPAGGANPGSVTFSWRVRREACPTC
ncbi:Ig domain-containing protein [Virgisporangium aurantiacum]|uniref:Uncharacterized protein n=1 Tax=Virgisporangium aurantiacum TaxID=175570 RepID=A0A8J3ZEV5_9ACTN|nr:Ig domain-containing protein [Virgisporangium aurantiacum]GIJ60321.1 hypothetical protein Vau01_078370 [Virgisporangium aurantiacum]